MQCYYPLFFGYKKSLKRKKINIMSVKKITKDTIIESLRFSLLGGVVGALLALLTNTFLLFPAAFLVAFFIAFLFSSLPKSK